MARVPTLGRFLFFPCLILAMCLAAAALAASPADKALTVIGGDDVLLGDFYSADQVSMGIAGNGDIYVAVISRPTFSSSTRLDVYRSTNGGQDWALWGTLDGATTFESYQQVDLVLGEGIVSRCFVAYTVASGDRRELRLATGDLGAPTMSFASPVTILSQSGVYCLDPELTTDAINFNTYYVYLTFSGADSSLDYGGDIWFTRSTDQGTTFASPYIVVTRSSAQVINQSPHLAYGFGDLVHLTWTLRSLDGSFDSAVRYRRATGAAAGGLPAWNPAQDLTSTSDGLQDMARGVDASPVGVSLAVAFASGVSGLVTDRGTLVSLDQGLTFTRHSSPAEGKLAGIRRNPVTGIWDLAYQSNTPSIQQSPVDDPTSWTALGWFGPLTSDPVALDQDFAFDPTRGSRVAAVWIAPDPVTFRKKLLFDAEWRQDPGFPVTEPGFPVALDSPPASAPAVVDIDGDGDLEIVFADKANRIQVYDHDGTPHPGWPVTIPESLSSGPVAIGDLNGDGKPLLVVGTLSGKVYGYGPAGSLETSWVYDTLSGAQAFPSIGHLAPPYGRIVAVASGQVVIFLNEEGRQVYNSTALFDRNLVFAPAFGDVDNDGNPEIIVASAYNLWNWNLTGTGFNVILSGAPGNSGRVSLADLDQDGDQEIVVPTSLGQLYVLQGDGSTEPGWPVSIGTAPLSSPAIGQLLGTSVPEIAVNSRDWLVDVRFANGSEGSGWPRNTGLGWFLEGMPLIGTLEGLSPDVLVGARDSAGWAWDNFGATLAGWPKYLDGPVNVTPAMGDVDLDGSQEALLMSDTMMWLVDMHQAPSLAINWPMAGHDPARTGCADCNEDLVSGIGGEEGGVTRVSFAAPAPNPVHGMSTFSFAIPQDAVVTLDVFDLRGRRIRRIEKAEMAPGPHVLTWDGRDDAGRTTGSGTYIATLTVRGPGIGSMLHRKITVVH